MWRLRARAGALLRSQSHPRTPASAAAAPVPDQAATAAAAAYIAAAPSVAAPSMFAAVRAALPSSAAGFRHGGSGVLLPQQLHSLLHLHAQPSLLLQPQRALHCSSVRRSDEDDEAAKKLAAHRERMRKKREAAAAAAPPPPEGGASNLTPEEEAAAVIAAARKAAAEATAAAEAEEALKQAREAAAAAAAREEADAKAREEKLQQQYQEEQSKPKGPAAPVKPPTWWGKLAQIYAHRNPGGEVMDWQGWKVEWKEWKKWKQFNKGRVAREQAQFEEAEREYKEEQRRKAEPPQTSARERALQSMPDPYARRPVPRPTLVKLSEWKADKDKKKRSTDAEEAEAEEMLVKAMEAKKKRETMVAEAMRAAEADGPDAVLQARADAEAAADAEEARALRDSLEEEEYMGCTALMVLPEPEKPLNFKRAIWMRQDWLDLHSRVWEHLKKPFRGLHYRIAPYILRPLTRYGKVDPRDLFELQEIAYQQFWEKEEIKLKEEIAAYKARGEPVPAGYPEFGPNDEMYEIVEFETDNRVVPILPYNEEDDYDPNYPHEGLMPPRTFRRAMLEWTIKELPRLDEEKRVNPDDVRDQWTKLEYQFLQEEAKEWLQDIKDYRVEPVDPSPEEQAEWDKNMIQWNKEIEELQAIVDGKLLPPYLVEFERARAPRIIMEHEEEEQKKKPKLPDPFRIRLEAAAAELNVKVKAKEAIIAVKKAERKAAREAKEKAEEEAAAAMAAAAAAASANAEGTPVVVDAAADAAAAATAAAAALSDVAAVAPAEEDAAAAAVPPPPAPREGEEDNDVEEIPFEDLDDDDPVVYMTPEERAEYECEQARMLFGDEGCKRKGPPILKPFTNPAIQYAGDDITKEPWYQWEQGMDDRGNPFDPEILKPDFDPDNWDPSHEAHQERQQRRKALERKRQMQREKGIVEEKPMNPDHLDDRLWKPKRDPNEFVDIFGRPLEDHSYADLLVSFFRNIAKLRTESKRGWLETQDSRVTRLRAAREVMSRDSDVSEALGEIMVVDPLFNEADFLEEMREIMIPEIITAFRIGDMKLLRSVVEEDAASQMFQVFRERMVTGEHPDPRILDIRGLDIVKAGIDNGVPYIQLTFVCQHIAKAAKPAPTPEETAEAEAAAAAAAAGGAAPGATAGAAAGAAPGAKPAGGAAAGAGAGAGDAKKKEEAKKGDAKEDGEKGAADAEKKDAKAEAAAAAAAAAEAAPSQVSSTYYSWMLRRDYDSLQYNWKIMNFQHQHIATLGV